jgi:hypothetical protein
VPITANYADFEVQAITANGRVAGTSRLFTR